MIMLFDLPGHLVITSVFFILRARWLDTREYAEPEGGKGERPKLALRCGT